MLLTLPKLPKLDLRARFVRNAANPLRKDPTRTTMVRKRFVAEMSRRFRRLKAHVKEFIAEQDALGLEEKKNPFVTLASPREFQFRTDAGKLSAFQEWFAQQVKADIFSPAPGTPADKPWVTPYITSAYKQGQLNAYLASRSALDETDPKFIDQSQAEFLRQSFNQPETTSKIELLATRSFEDLKGVTSQMGSNMNRILSQGMIDGSSPTEIAKEMADNIDTLTNTRALLIARTETIFAHAEGQLDAFERLGVTELGVKAEWSTAGDDRVCPECMGYEGKVFDIEDAHGLIPLHPNCRCAWIPASKEDVAKAEAERGGAGPDAGPQASANDIEGSSLVSIIRRAGEQGMSFTDTKAMFERSGIRAADQTIRIQLKAGRDLKGTLAPLDLLERINSGKIIIAPRPLPLPPIPKVKPVAPGVIERFAVGHLKDENLIATEGRTIRELENEMKRLRDAGINLQEQADIAKFQTDFGMSPDKFKEIMLKDLEKHDIKLQIRRQGETWTIEGQTPSSAVSYVEGKQVDRSITFTRRWNKATKEVENDYFKLGNDLQSGGVSNSVLGNQLRIWDHLGVEKIQVHANIDVGGYTWARYGFVPKQSSWDSIKMTLQRQYVGSEAGATPGSVAFAPTHKLPEEMRLKLKEILELKDPRDGMRALSSFKDRLAPVRSMKFRVEGHTLGKEALLGQDWYGTMNLTNSKDYSYFRDYLKMPGEVPLPPPVPKDVMKLFQAILDKSTPEIDALKVQMEKWKTRRLFNAAKSVQDKIDALYTDQFHAALRATREGERFNGALWKGDEMKSALLREEQSKATVWLKDTVNGDLLERSGPTGVIQHNEAAYRANFMESIKLPDGTSVGGAMHMGPRNDAQVFVHEFGHHLQNENRSTLFASEKDFLVKRNLDKFSLDIQEQERKHPGRFIREETINGRKDETGWTDAFKEKGGSDYTGRRYEGSGKLLDKDWKWGEVTTMGMQRLYQSPAEFFRNDPEFFKWVVDNIQKKVKVGP